MPLMNHLKSWLTLGLDRPRLVLGGVVLLVLGAVAFLLLSPLEISTSRRSLVSTNSPYQARLFRYYEEFGRSEFAALVVSGATPDARRKLVDRFEHELVESSPEYRGRVLGKVTLDDVAETLLVWHPEILELLRVSNLDSEQQGVDPWVTWSERATRRLTDQLEGSPSSAGAAGAALSKTQAAQQLNRVTGAIAALKRAIEGDGELAIGNLGLGTGAAQMDEQGYLVGRGGDYHLVLIYPELQSDEGSELRPIIQNIRRARDRALAGFADKGVRADLTGAPALAVDELASIRAGSRVTSVLAACGIVLLLFWVFRSFRHTLITLIPLLAGIVITLGLVNLFYGHLNLVTASFMSVLMGLGIDFGVHLFHRYKEGRAEGQSLEVALRAAILGASPAIAAGAVTTIGAFLASTFTEFAAFRELGVITATGLTVLLICAFLLIPTSIRLFAGEPRVWVRELWGASTLARVVRSRARLVLWVTLLVTGVAAASLYGNPPSFNGRYFDFLPANVESYRALQFILKGGTPPAEAHFKVDSFVQARALAKKLRQLPEVSIVQTPSDLFPPETPDGLGKLARAIEALHGRSPKLPRVTAEHAKARIQAFTDLADAFDEVAFALRQANLSGESATRASRELSALVRWLKEQPDLGTRALGKVSASLERAFVKATRVARKVVDRGEYAPEDLPPVFRVRFASKDQKHLALHVYPAGDIWEPAFADRFARQLTALDPEVAGVALNVVPHQRYIIEGFERATVYSLCFVTLVLWITFRRLSDVFISLLPVGLGWLWMLALMQPLGLQFTAANLVALPLLLGIGLDTGVHLVHRSRHSHDASVALLLKGTGTAVVVAAVTNMIGYGALIAADYRAMRGLGMLLSMGIGLCLLASLVVLPALLVVLRRAG